jgi:hypothetical protein
LREARNWFNGNFKVRTLEEWTALCAPGTEANASYRMVTSYWEMVASFITSGVLNPELFLSERPRTAVLLRARPPCPADIAGKTRQSGRNEEPRNRGEGFIAWWNQQSPAPMSVLQAHRRLGAASGNGPFAA